MELLAEISKLKQINSELIELLDQLVRKQVHYEHQLQERAKAPTPKQKVEQSLPKPESQRLWVRVKDICRSKQTPDSMLPISRSAWYRGVEEGRFPQPKKFGRMALLKYEDIKNLIDEI